MEEKNKTLIERYNDLANEYAMEFTKNYYACSVDEEGGVNTYETFWVGDEPGGLFYINDDWHNYETIRYAVDNHIAKAVLYEWYEYCSEFWAIDTTIYTPTLEEWCNGYKRIAPEKLKTIKELHGKVVKAKFELECAIDDFKKNSKKYEKL